MNNPDEDASEDSFTLHINSYLSDSYPYYGDDDSREENLFPGEFSIHLPSSLAPESVLLNKSPPLELQIISLKLTGIELQQKEKIVLDIVRQQPDDDDSTLQNQSVTMYLEAGNYTLDGLLQQLREMQPSQLYFDFVQYSTLGAQQPPNRLMLISKLSQSQMDDFEDATLSMSRSLASKLGFCNFNSLNPHFSRLISFPLMPSASVTRERRDTGAILAQNFPCPSFQVNRCCKPFSFVADTRAEGLVVARGIKSPDLLSPPTEATVMITNIRPFSAFPPILYSPTFEPIEKDNCLLSCHQIPEEILNSVYRGANVWESGTLLPPLDITRQVHLKSQSLQFKIVDKCGHPYPLNRKGSVELLLKVRRSKIYPPFNNN